MSGITDIEECILSVYVIMLVYQSKNERIEYVGRTRTKKMVQDADGDYNVTAADPETSEWLPSASEEAYQSVKNRRKFVAETDEASQFLSLADLDSSGGVLEFESSDLDGNPTLISIFHPRDAKNSEALAIAIRRKGDNTSGNTKVYLHYRESSAGVGSFFLPVNTEGVNDRANFRDSKDRAGLYANNKRSANLSFTEDTGGSLGYFGTGEVIDNGTQEYVEASLSILKAAEILRQRQEQKPAA